mmetsp:Transcript_19005/g.44330  ORF Transcript_19005/g.44330 Transcript_19005/m.44330 type:complete len:779 (+) Transcript_19005:83-2419(+)
MQPINQAPESRDPPPSAPTQSVPPPSVPEWAKNLPRTPSGSITTPRAPSPQANIATLPPLDLTALCTPLPGRAREGAAVLPLSPRVVPVEAAAAAARNRSQTCVTPPPAPVIATPHCQVQAEPTRHVPLRGRPHSAGAARASAPSIRVVSPRIMEKVASVEAVGLHKDLRMTKTTTVHPPVRLPARHTLVTTTTHSTSPCPARPVPSPRVVEPVALRGSAHFGSRVVAAQAAEEVACSPDFSLMQSPPVEVRRATTPPRTPRRFASRSRSPRSQAEIDDLREKLRADCSALRTKQEAAAKERETLQQQRDVLESECKEHVRTLQQQAENLRFAERRAEEAEEAANRRVKQATAEAEELRLRLVNVEAARDRERHLATQMEDEKLELEKELSKLEKHSGAVLADCRMLQSKVEQLENEKLSLKDELNMQADRFRREIMECDLSKQRLTGQLDAQSSQLRATKESEEQAQSRLQKMMREAEERKRTFTMRETVIVEESNSKLAIVQRELADERALLKKAREELEVARRLAWQHAEKMAADMKDLVLSHEVLLTKKEAEYQERRRCSERTHRSLKEKVKELSCKLTRFEHTSSRSDSPRTPSTHAENISTPRSRPPSPALTPRPSVEHSSYGPASPPASGRCSFVAEDVVLSQRQDVVRGSPIAAELVNVSHLRGGTMPDAIRTALDEVRRHGWDRMRWNGGFTLLHWAAKHDHQDLYQELLELGADAEAMDHSGRTAMDYHAQKTMSPPSRSETSSSAPSPPLQRCASTPCFHETADDGQ